MKKLQISLWLFIIQGSYEEPQQSKLIFPCLQMCRTLIKIIWYIKSRDGERGTVPGKSLLIFSPLYSFSPSKTLLNKLINPSYFHFKRTSSTFHGIFFSCLLTVESFLSISSLFLAFWKKISTAISIHTLTNKRTHKITHFWRLFIDLRLLILLFPKK